MHQQVFHLFLWTRYTQCKIHNVNYTNFKSADYTTEALHSSDRCSRDVHFEDRGETFRFRDRGETFELLRPRQGETLGFEIEARHFQKYKSRLHRGESVTKTSCYFPVLRLLL